MTFDKLQPGTIVYDVMKHRMGNTMCKTVSVYEVEIISRCEQDQTVLAKWNNNQTQRYWPHTWKKWRVKRPVTVTGLMGQQRLARRGEKPR